MCVKISIITSFSVFLSLLNLNGTMKNTIYYYVQYMIRITDCNVENIIPNAVYGSSQIAKLWFSERQLSPKKSFKSSRSKRITPSPPKSISYSPQKSPRIVNHKF